MTWLRRLPQAPVTLALLVANLAVYAAMALGSGEVGSFGVETLVRAGATVSLPGTSPTAWRWMSAAFIHVNVLHIAMNLWVLAQIGVLTERAVGRGLFAAAYLITGVTGNALSATLASVRGRELVSAGASGAIMGLIGLAAVYAWRTGQRAIARSLLMNVVFVMVVGLSLSAKGVVAVDNAAHAGGLVVGALFGLLRARFPRPLSRRMDALLTGLAAAVTVMAFGVVRAYGGDR